GKNREERKKSGTASRESRSRRPISFETQLSRGPINGGVISHSPFISRRDVSQLQGAVELFSKILPRPSEPGRAPTGRPAPILDSTSALRGGIRYHVRDSAAQRPVEALVGFPRRRGLLVPGHG